MLESQFCQRGAFVHFHVAAQGSSSTSAISRRALRAKSPWILAKQDPSVINFDHKTLAVLRHVICQQTVHHSDRMLEQDNLRKKIWLQTSQFQRLSSIIFVKCARTSSSQGIQGVEWGNICIPDFLLYSLLFHWDAPPTGYCHPHTGRASPSCFIFYVNFLWKHT